MQRPRGNEEFGLQDATEQLFEVVRVVGVEARAVGSIDVLGPRPVCSMNVLWKGCFYGRLSRTCCNNL